MLVTGTVNRLDITVTIRRAAKETKPLQPSNGRRKIETTAYSATRPPIVATPPSNNKLFQLSLGMDLNWAVKQLQEWKEKVFSGRLGLTKPQPTLLANHR